MTEELKRLNIEISSKCNYRCVSCPNSRLPRGNGNIDPDLFFKIFKETGDQISQVMLWNYGEPLLHPKISTLLKNIRKYKCKKTISTTGWKLEDFEDLSFMTSLDEIIISINGFTPEVYDIHQKGGNLAKVIRGVKRLAPILDKSKTKLIMQTVATRDNITQLVNAKDFARELGFHDISTKSFNVMDNSPQTFQQFVPLGTPYSRYKDNNLTTKLPENVSPPCLKWMVINWDGSVNPCCWDYQGKYVLGNVKDNGVYSIWKSLTAIKHRKKMKDRDFLDICLDCNGNKKIELEVK